jgi:hypothetical protein
MRTFPILWCVFATAVCSLWADMPAPQIPYVTAAPGGEAYFKMIPSPDGKWGDGFGIAYRLREDGTDVELWRTKGWYSHEVFLSVDGEYLVVMGPWNRGHSPNPEDLAVAFYRRGTLLRQYSTAQLVKDGSKVFTTASHYRWLARDLERYTKVKKDPESELRIIWKNTFRLKTCDGILYDFDITTGEIIKKKT